MWNVFHIVVIVEQFHLYDGPASRRAGAIDESSIVDVCVCV